MFKDYVRVTESINPGESKDVTFEWLNIAGNHMITVVANDMEDSLTKLILTIIS